MNNKIRWGVLGVAGIAVKKVIPAMQRGEHTQVTAIASRDLAKAQAVAGPLGIAKSYGSYEELLADPEIDAVYNPLPNHLHVPWSILAAEAGKHVLCEKPFARDVAEGRSVLAAAERASIVHLLGTEFRFDTGQALLARTVRAGAVGVPRVATIILHVPMLADASSEVPEWWADAAQGGGWLGAHGSQVIDQIRVTLGEFRAVTAAVAHVAPHVPAWSADDGFLVHFVMESGAVGTMQSTPSDRGPMIVETRVVGSQGSAWIEGLGSTVKIADADGTRTVPVPDDLVVADASAPPRSGRPTTYEQMTAHGLDLGPYTRLAEHFLARINGTEPPAGPAPATFTDGVADLAVLDAMRSSASSGLTIEVSP